MLTTLLPPTSGRAWVAGYDVVKQGQQVRGVMGAALQEVALDPNLTGREHLILQGALQGLPKSDRRRRAGELLERVGLTEAANRRTQGYSGGMRRRLDLALALVHGPSILFLDEPTTGLDVQSRTALWEEVRRLARDDGVTVLLTTQYLEEADALADRVGIIHRGHIVAEGTPAALKSEIGRRKVEVVPVKRTATRKLEQVLGRFGDVEPGAQRGALAVRLTDDGDGDGGLARIVRALDAGGIEVENLEVHAPTLDDVFLLKTGTSLEGAAEGPPANGP
jgi:ABC-2 type transport system ATP-binding protein